MWPFAHSRIAVVELTGVLGAGPRSGVYLRLLERLSFSRRARAVVIEVDSPGGTVAACDRLHRAVARLAGKKPVVAFIRGLGTSGAYLTGAAATRLVALPSAIVGSIGVISIHPLAPGLLDKLGLRFQVAKGGRLKDMGAFYREPTEEEKEKEQALVDEYYEDFVATVARCRGLGVEQVKPLATGEVFSGRRAKELGLVDELGDMEQALEIASTLAGVSRRYYYLRPRRPFLERLLSPMVAGTLDEIESRFPFRLYYM